MMEGWQSKRVYQSLIDKVQHPNTPKNTLVKLAYQFLIGNVQQKKYLHPHITKKYQSLLGNVQPSSNETEMGFYG